MPKKEAKDSPEAQRERFEKAVRDAIDAGELNPTEADAALDSIVRNQAEQRSPPNKRAV